MTEFHCQNCGYTDDESAFPRALAVLQRHEVGDTFTDRECPECSSLAHPTTLKGVVIGKAGLEAFKADVNAPYHLAQQAFDIAIKHIQDTLGVASGGFAAQFWSGYNYEPVLQLTTYARGELEHGLMKARAQTG